MDRIDLSVLEALESDGRQSFGDLASKVGLSKTPCWSRVRALETAGVILGYRADIDRRSLGLDVMGLVTVIIDSKRRADFERAVVSTPFVLECYTTLGEADYVLKVVCRDLSHLDDFLRHDLSLLPGVQRTTTMLCPKPIKQRGSVVIAASESGVDKGRFG